MPDFSYHIFHQDSDTLLAICDYVILGQTFEEGDMQIEVSREFYHEKECQPKEVKNLIRNATIVNAVGKEIVSLLVKEKIADEEHVLVIDGVPHVQIIKI